MTQTPPPPAGGAKLIIVAIVLALAAVVLTNLYIDYVRHEVERSSFEVYVLNRSVLPGDTLQLKDVRARAVPNTFRESLADLGAMDRASLDLRITERRPVRRSANQGSLVTHALFDAPEGADLDQRITQGRRLVSLPVNSRTMPANLQPGSFVDLEAPFNRGAAVAEVMPVMERVKVMAVGARSVTDEEASGRPRPLGSYRAITIEVTPQEATQLAMIERLAAGDFEVHLRNPADLSVPKIKEGGINPEVIDLLDLRRREPAPARR